MDKSKFDVIFPVICADLAEKLKAELNLSEKDAITQLYSSYLYGKLEKEETKVWQYSTSKLFEMFLEEKNTGKIIFPEI